MKYGDIIYRQAAIEVIDAVFPVDPMKSEYAQGIACGAALAKTYVEQLPSAQPEIIHCESCEHWKNEHLCECLSRHGTFETPKNFYCGYGKRRADGR